MRRAIRPKPLTPTVAKFGSGTFPKISSAIPALHRFLVGTLIDRTRGARDPVVLNKLGLGGAEMRCARAHETLDVGDGVVLEISDLDEVVAINGYVRAVEPSRIIVAFGTATEDVRRSLERLVASYGG